MKTAEMPAWTGLAPLDEIMLAGVPADHSKVEGGL